MQDVRNGHIKISTIFWENDQVTQSIDFFRVYLEWNRLFYLLLGVNIFILITLAFKFNQYIYLLEKCHIELLQKSSMPTPVDSSVT
jgi:hypothetical protein